MPTKSKLPLYTILGSLAVYILIALVFVFSFSNFLAFGTSSDRINIVEGLLLPKTDFPISNIFNTDPLLTNSDSDTINNIRRSVSFLIFSSLFKETIDKGLTPDIVESYEFKDATNLNLKIRQNIKWHDGTDLTATDVEFTFGLIKSTRQNSLYAGATNGGSIQVAVIDDYNLKIELTGTDGVKPDSSFLNELVFPILPKHILENYPLPSLNELSETEFGRNPIGSGILKYNQNLVDELVLDRNDNYYQDPVRFNSYTFRFYKDYPEMLKDYKLKNIDIVKRNEVGSLDSVYKDFIDSGFNYEEKVLRGRRVVLYINLASKNDSSQLAKSTFLRRSLLNIIDRKKLVDSIDIGREIYGPIDQSLPEFSPDILEKEKYNLEEFNKILGILGYKKVNEVYEKDGIQVKVKLSYLSGSIREPLVAELTRQLKEVGIILIPTPINEVDDNLISNSSVQTKTNDFYSVVNERNFDVLLTSVDHAQNADLYDEWHSSRINAPGLNLSSFSSNGADRALENGRINVGDERKTDYMRFQKTFFEETPAIYLLNPGIQIYSNPRLNLGKINELSSMEYFYLNISEWEVKV
jgi:peptide/nickel transport system substrate-binding protein